MTLQNLLKTMLHYDTRLQILERQGDSNDLCSHFGDTPYLGLRNPKR